MSQANEQNRPHLKLHWLGDDGRNIELVAQGQLFKLRVLLPGHTNGGDRWIISEFSAKSRKRMLDLLASIDWQRAGFVCFVTLTYPDRNGPPSPGQADRDRRTFLKRIARRWPDASAIWRREWRPRKSGEFVGVCFAHLHLMFFGLPFVEHDEINTLWAETIGHDDYVRTEIKGLANWRQAISYMAKYMAKPVEQVKPGGQAAGGGGPVAASAAPAAPGGEAADCSLVNVPYRTGEVREGEGKKEEEEEKKKSEEGIGRAWGVFNRKRLPLAAVTSRRLEPGPWLKEAIQKARAIWPHAAAYPGCGFTLFVDDAAGFLGAAVDQHDNDQQGGVG